MAFSPVQASETIKNKYYRYLKAIFKPAQPYAVEFDTLLQNTDAFAAGPYLDLTDAFQKGVSIRELIEEGLLPVNFLSIGMNPDRPLYLHQEQSIRKIAQHGKNIVVSTGTGSGKTESFLIPVLRELAMEAQANTLDAGVRALLIYPMNALANDQTERLRELLKDFPQITFGTYTGQTKMKEADARAEYAALNDHAEPLPNEMISRERMIETPPHILITNYAMLEYLLLRPRDSIFFERENAGKWKFIVFDEAHVYNGSTGIEVSMLFRRLCARLENKNIRFILTSATLGDENENDKVAEFATKLCNAPFSAEDVIRASRIVPVTERGLQQLPTSFYQRISQLKQADRPDKEVAAAAGLSPEASLADGLYDLIVHDQNYWRMRQILQRPQTVQSAAEQMGWTQTQITDFVQVASCAERDGGKLFDARYHMFLRAADSAFVTLEPDAHIMLDRCKYRVDPRSGNMYKVFEIGVCSFCGAVFLTGRVDKQTGCLEQQSSLSDSDTDGDAYAVFLLGDSVSDTDADHTFEDEGMDTQRFEICPHCGFLRTEGSTVCCDHVGVEMVKVQRIALKPERQNITKCPYCENTRSTGVLRRFFSGQEAATSVIGTALFEALPSYKITIEENKESEEDEFGFGVSDDSSSETEHKEKVAKQFIAFSDSRQAAAFYATYLNSTYNTILYKRLIMETLQGIHEPCLVSEFADRLQNCFEKNGIKGRSALDSSNSSDYFSKKEAWKAVLSELTDNNGNTSLTHFGLIDIALDTRNSDGKEWTWKACSLDAGEFRDLCGVFALSMLADAAVYYQDADTGLTEDDREDFTHNGIMYSYTLSDPSGRYHRAFLPAQAGKSNKRVDYLQRIWRKKNGTELDDDSAAERLEQLWKGVFLRGNLLHQSDGIAYQIDISKISIDRPKHVYICNKCRRVSCDNIAGVCPSYRCDGELIDFDPQKAFQNDHYYRIYHDLEMRDLRVVEHTAQLDRDSAYDYQKKFKQKQIDILSCSTTFEMGVDVGSLETVFMRNMPPSPSNYAQRAGRAGRSKLSAAFALTFCNKGSHDFSFFRNPTEMIKGKIAPPRYTVENDRIAIRHLYASVMSFFWRLYPALFGSIGNFLAETVSGSGYDRLCAFLSSKPEDLRDYLKMFLPQSLCTRFGVETYGWVPGLLGEDGVLTKAIHAYQYDVNTLREIKEENYSTGKKVDPISSRIKAYETENILTFLSRKGVLPKYGFPVDTVEMTVTADSRGKTYGLQLSRDLSMAISEYAPGSQIVANNNLITSQYINKIPGIGWKLFSYIKCDKCNTMNAKVFTEDTVIACCSQCKQPFNKTPRVFLIPEQGFIADGSKVRKPGLKKPERTYHGEVSYLGLDESTEKAHYNIGNADVSVRSTHDDELVVVNESNFFVCDSCGYADVDKDRFTSTKKKAHKRPNGTKCGCDLLYKRSLGYRFRTDVVQIRFENCPIDDFEKGLSILHGLLRGISRHLNIEESEISGCLQSYTQDYQTFYSLIIFDNTPGGAGHVKRINDGNALEGALRKTMQMMRSCTCGGEAADTSCYSCLRSYRNQKYHDILRRDYVISFLEDVI